jgi:hypothetical protein
MTNLKVIREASESFGGVSTHRMAKQSQHNTKQTADNHKLPEKEWNLRSQQFIGLNCMSR